eukprot:Phypoly_transcript_13402.p1 GENE.Phypoly_transcript_13402~~Phypoly_transcript_13402.p1  ORF type:complete len:313 (+),score=60.05 Phypoly_transcript_13402:108-1046(+)
MGMSAFMPGQAQPPREQSLQVIDEAIEAGVNFFNTAEFYGLEGHNERLLGEAIKKHGRENFIIASKFGLVRDAKGGIAGFDASPENTRKSLEKSLQNLGIDCIDIYMPARVDPKVPIEETVRALKQLKEEGKIKYLGLSEVSAATIRRAHVVHPISVIESEFSLWSLHLRDEVIPTMRELGISLLAYSPLGRGFLSGEIKKPEDIPDNDFRKHVPRFNEHFDHNMQLVAAVEKLAQQKGVTNSQLALAWILAQGNDIIPIPGTTKVTRLHENLAAANIQLTHEELAEIEDVISKFEVKGTRYPAHSMSMLQQ